MNKEEPDTFGKHAVLYSQRCTSGGHVRSFFKGNLNEDCPQGQPFVAIRKEFHHAQPAEVWKFHQPDETAAAGWVYKCDLSLPGS